jgi:hypothetical protein
MEILFLKYFWPGLIALPKNTPYLFIKGQELPNTDYLEQPGHTIIINDVEERVHSILQQQISRDQNKNSIKINGWNHHMKDKRKGQRKVNIHTACRNQRRERVSLLRATKLSHAHPPLMSPACKS